MLKQLEQQWNGRRTDVPDDFKRLLMQLFIVTGEESSQQRERTPSPFGQGGFGGSADLGVVGQQTICPVTDQGRISGKTRLSRGQRRLGQRDPLVEVGSQDHCESKFRQG